MGDFPPWKALPSCETDCYGRIEVASRRGRASDNGKGDTNGEGPADLEERAECCDSKRALGINSERGN